MHFVQHPDGSWALSSEAAKKAWDTRGRKDPDDARNDDDKRQDRVSRRAESLTERRERLDKATVEDDDDYEEASHGRGESAPGTTVVSYGDNTFTIYRGDQYTEGEWDYEATMDDGEASSSSYDALLDYVKDVVTGGDEREHDSNVNYETREQVRERYKQEAEINKRNRIADEEKWAKRYAEMDKKREKYGDDWWKMPAGKTALAQSPEGHWMLLDSAAALKAWETRRGGAGPPAQESARDRLVRHRHDAPDPKPRNAGVRDVIGPYADGVRARRAAMQDLVDAGTIRTISTEPKDRRRINDIVTKANGDVDKMNRLAANMARSITKPDKALRRALAAEDVNEHEMAAIFFVRYDQLKPRRRRSDLSWVQVDGHWTLVNLDSEASRKAWDSRGRKEMEDRVRAIKDEIHRTGKLVDPDAKHRMPSMPDHAKYIDRGEWTEDRARAVKAQIRETGALPKAGGGIVETVQLPRALSPPAKDSEIAAVLGDAYEKMEPMEKRDAKMGVFKQYEHAAKVARADANKFKRPMGLEKAKEYGKTVFRVKMIAKDPADRFGWASRVEVVDPDDRGVVVHRAKDAKRE